MTTLDYLHGLVIPVAYELLPTRMNSREATAMLLAIALQETNAEHRRQFGNGPATGFWQFERGGGVQGVLEHRTVGPIITSLCEQTFQYSPTAIACHDAIEHNDILAACFARLLLWTLPAALPNRDEPDLAFAQYLATWRPGRPRPEDWPTNFATGWATVAP